MKMTAQSTSNTDAGTYQVLMNTTLVSYPSVSVPSSAFTVTITPNEAPTFATAPQYTHSIVKT